MTRVCPSVEVRVETTVAGTEAGASLGAFSCCRGVATIRTRSPERSGSPGIWPWVNQMPTRDWPLTGSGVRANEPCTTRPPAGKSAVARWPTTSEIWSAGMGLSAGSGVRSTVIRCAAVITSPRSTAVRTARTGRVLPTAVNSQAAMVAPKVTASRPAITYSGRRRRRGGGGIPGGTASAPLATDAEPGRRTREDRPFADSACGAGAGVEVAPAVIDEVLSRRAASPVPPTSRCDHIRRGPPYMSQLR